MGQLEKTEGLADQAYDLVEGAMTVATDRALTAYDAAVAALNDIKSLSFLYPASFTPPEFNWELDPKINSVEAPTLPSWYSMGMNLPELKETELTGFTNGTAPTFDKPYVTLSIPTPPAPISLGTVPTLDPIDYSDLLFPPAPTLVKPTMDTLTAITVPVFTMPTFPSDFTELAPDFTVADPNATPNWTESTYTPDILADVRAVIERLMMGAAIPPAVEQALWDRARAREDANAQKAVADAFTDWAGRGFTMPPGMLAEQVNVARQQALLSTNSLSRDVAIKHAEWMQENVRFSVVQGLAYEAVLINLWENAVKRAFEIAKYTVEMQVKLYEVQVGVFKARMEAFRIKADVWKTRLEGVKVQLDAYLAQLQAEKTKGEINDQKVRVFTSLMNALNTEVELYKAEVSTVGIKADVIKTKVQIYGEQIAGYTAWLNAQKVAFEAFDIQVKAETSKATFLEAATRAYAAEVQAFSTVEETKIKRYEVDAKVMALRVDAYKAKLDAARVELDMVINTNRVELERFDILMGKYKADQNLNAERAKLAVTATDALLRDKIAYFDAKVREWDSAARIADAKTEIQSRALQAIAQNATGLANATMSSIHYGTQFSGGGSMSAGYNVSGPVV